jgi:hypothetical protein
MAAELTRHLLKAAGLIAIFAGILTATAVAIAYFGQLFLRSNKISLRPGASWFQVASRSFTGFARRKRLSIVVVGLSCLAFRGALLPLIKVPAPKAHDEFSYLLAGDTFAHGRLTNPTPPMWIHFESMHINVKPTYMSMYPPGQGFILALGQWLGHPWIAIWLLAGFSCAMICWALQGWLPPKWALLGGVLAVLQFGVLCYWSNTYYCTWLPALGGALVLGALWRVLKRPSVLQAVLLAIGVSVLAVTRPYEGLIFCLPVAGLMLFRLLSAKREMFRRMITRTVLPVTSVLVLLALFLGYYNFRVSGKPLLMPYRLNQQTYAVVPLFIWQPLSAQTPVYLDAEMRNYYLGWEVSEYHNTVTCGFVRMTWIKFERYWFFYFGPILSFALLTVPWVLVDSRIRFLLVVIAFTMVGAELEVWSHPHYVAALTCALLAVVLQCMRHLQFWTWGNWRIGRAMVWAIVIGCFAFDVAWVSAAAVHVKDTRLYMVGNEQRAMMERQLEQLPGNHLVFVRYRPSHPVFREWVYNRADIDRAKVVWARDLGQGCDEKLVHKLRDRDVWVIEPDTNPMQLEPYSPSVAGTAEGNCKFDDSLE